MKLNHRLILCFFTLLIFCLAGCEDESVPVIPDPVQPEEPITEVPLPNGVEIKLQLSDVLLCPGEEISISIKNIVNDKSMGLDEVNFRLSPEVGRLDLETGKYQAPIQLDGPIHVELMAEYKNDTSIKSGEIIRLRPNDPTSYVLTQFAGIDHAVDSGQLPDGSLVFASSNPVEPPMIVGEQFKFEIYSTDQQGNLLWHTNLGPGLLRRIYVGREAIYGFGYLDGYVLVKFDFQGNLLAKNHLGVGQEQNHLTIESMLGNVNLDDDFICMITAHHPDQVYHSLFKFDRDLNPVSSKLLPRPSFDILPLGNSGYVLTGIFNGDFTVTDSDFEPLWTKNLPPNILAKTEVIKNGSKWEIWTINREYQNNSNSTNLIIHDELGNQLSSKKLDLSGSLYFYNFFGIEQLPNGDIWLVANGDKLITDKPYLEDNTIGNFFHLIKLSPTGEILDQAWVEDLGFRPPDFPGGFPLKYFGLYQGENGLILSGKWYSNFLIQFNSQNSYSPC